MHQRSDQSSTSCDLDPGFQLSGSTPNFLARTSAQAQNNIHAQYYNIVPPDNRLYNNEPSIQSYTYDNNQTNKGIILNLTAPHAFIATNNKQSDDSIQQDKINEADASVRNPASSQLSNTKSIPRRKDNRAKQRDKPSLVCTNCKRRKIKCDRKSPCQSCDRINISYSCYYQPKPPKKRKANKAASISVENVDEKKLPHITVTKDLVTPQTPPQVVQHQAQQSAQQSAQRSAQQQIQQQIQQQAQQQEHFQEQQLLQLQILQLQEQQQPVQAQEQQPVQPQEQPQPQEQQCQPMQTSDYYHESLPLGLSVSDTTIASSHNKTSHDQIPGDGTNELLEKSRQFRIQNEITALEHRLRGLQALLTPATSESSIDEQLGILPVDPQQSEYITTSLVPHVFSPVMSDDDCMNLLHSSGPAW